MRHNEEQVLEYVNGLRKQYGIGDPLTEMPPDLTVEQYEADNERMARYCPVGSALEKRCGSAAVSLTTPWGVDEDVWFPKYVAEFIDDHDRRFVDLLIGG